jgi:2-phospho-L-lactate guanylyltransferase
MKPMIVVPMKDMPGAKSRMSPALTVEERSQLAWAMFCDVSRTLRNSKQPVGVLTNSTMAAGLGRKMGWRIFWESSQTSESESVDAASRQLASEGVPAVLRLPADIPLIQSCDVEELMSGTIPLRSAVLVPSRNYMGTNAILRSPPDIFRSRFGPGSLALHLQEALSVGAACRVLANARLALDLDELSDLACFIEKPSDTETFRLLQQLGLPERLVAHVTNDH